MAGTQGLSSAFCQNSCLTDVNELLVHKSTGKSVAKGACNEHPFERMTHVPK